MSFGTQNLRVAKWLLNHHTITQREAALELACWRLGARIWDIRQAVGEVVIETQIETHKNGYHAKYVLANPLALSTWLTEQENTHDKN